MFKQEERSRREIEYYVLLLFIVHID